MTTVKSAGLAPPQESSIATAELINLVAGRAYETLLERLAPPPLSLDYIKLSPHAELPFQAYGDSVGFDLSAMLISENGRSNTTVLSPQVTSKIRTGLALRAPPGYALFVCSRSGLASKGVYVANAPGIVDPSYTGEIFVLLHNGGYEKQYIKHGDRIAQAVLVPFANVGLREVAAFDPSARGDKGFGSSG